jgi:hypothetical protein
MLFELNSGMILWLRLDTSVKMSVWGLKKENATKLTPVALNYLFPFLFRQMITRFEHIFSA